jgi:tetratricopeptide (TPR) repeat protein
MSMDELVNIIKKLEIEYIEINEDIFEIVHKIFKHNEIDLDITYDNPVVCYYIGVYLHFIKKNMNNTMKYYLPAIDAGIVPAMYYAGHYHYNVTENYKEAVCYYKMAINKKCYKSMNNLGVYYNDIEKNIQEARRYYHMAIEHGSSRVVMKNLACSYKHDKCYTEYLKYALMYIREHNNETFTQDVVNYFNNNIDIVNYNLYADELALPAETIDKYNRIILEARHADKIVITFECTNCLETCMVAYKKCGHYFCIDCFKNKCRLCDGRSI